MHTLQPLPLHARQPFTLRVRLTEIHIAVGEAERAAGMLRHEGDAEGRDVVFDAGEIDVDAGAVREVLVGAGLVDELAVDVER